MPRPSTKAPKDSTANLGFEAKLWLAADKLRNNMDAAEYKHVVLGLIFLKYISDRFEEHHAKLAAGQGDYAGANPEDPDEYRAENVFWVPSEARWGHLQAGAKLPAIGKTVDDAMVAIERDNPRLKGVLPKDYARPALDKHRLGELIDLIGTIGLGDTESRSKDILGRVYEYFLTQFASAEGKNGGQFYTPSCIVRLLVEMLAPYRGRIYDPACGSGGMFVQSARFVAEHQKNPAAELAIFGVEKTDETGRLCRLNLAVHGLEGDIKHGGNINSYYDDPHKATGAFDFVLANPPFNVNAVDKERLKDMVGAGRRFPFGLPRTDNANYLWIQLFYSALNAAGRAGFVMANSASDARSSEQELRQKLIEARAVDVMVAVGPNMFYTVTLPCTLWFLDKGKAKTKRADTVLFIDARHIYRQVDRAHRDWTPAQIGFIANLVRLYRGEALDAPKVGAGETAAKLIEVFGDTPAYRNVPGLCKAATLAEIEAQGWSLNPGRYVGVAPGEEVSDEDFKEQLETLNEELESLNAQARELEQTIAANVAGILEA